MSKQDILSPKIPREKWGPEARICASIWSLQQKLRATKLMEMYIETKVSLDDIEVFLTEKDDTNIIQDLEDLKQEVFNFITPIVRSDVYKRYVPEHFQVLNELGTVLADSQWWDRYMAITGVMGVECVLSIRTAESLFKRDPKADEIRTVLKKLVEVI